MSKVFVGLSGGVDSAVSAALLKEEGHEVVGAFIKIWNPAWLGCTSKEDRLDAIRVCAALEIPFKEVDLSEEYEREVAGAMVAAYARGSTPNPDVACNEKIKFGRFAAWAFAEGAERIATGHYARTRNRALLRGLDASKDQSYFLNRMERDTLRRTLFPVGELQKSQVRALAKKFGLPVSDKPDSQGLCFVGELSMREYLSHYVKPCEGAVVDAMGRRIGTHYGAALYTIGERHGFSTDAKTSQYVTGIDIERNELRVSGQRSDAARRSFPLSDVHWIGDAPQMRRGLYAQVRYRESALVASLSKSAHGYSVELSEPRIVAAGQSVAFYIKSGGDEQCLGGGIAL